MPVGDPGRPKGSQDVDLQQDAAGRLIVAGAAAAPMPMDLKQYLNAPCGPANPINVEDTGLHTNPRQYEKDNGFVSLPIARAGGVATAVWSAGVAAINPVGGRTAGRITTVYSIELRNPNAAAQTAWLENGAGVVLSVVYELAPLDTVIIDYLAGKNFGNRNLFINASVNGVECQISGTEAV